MRHLIRLLAICLFLVESVGSASTGCPFLGFEATKWQQAGHFAKTYSVIFEGELESVDEVRAGNPGEGYRYRFRVVRSYKGQDSAYLELYAVGKLRPDARYLVFWGGLLPCPLFVEAEDAATELRYLRGEAPQESDLITLEEYFTRLRRPNAGSICGKIVGFPEDSLPKPLFRLWFEKKGEWDWDASDSLQARIMPGGRYCIPGVNPGEYVLTLTVYNKEKTMRFVGMPGSVTGLSLAPRITVRDRAESRAPDLVLVSQPMFTVRGKVVLSDGRVPAENQGSMLLRLDSLDESPFDIAPATNETIGGSFIIAGVPAGNYILRGWYSLRQFADDGKTLLKEEEAETGEEVTVAGDLSGIRVVLRLGAKKE